MNLPTEFIKRMKIQLGEEFESFIEAFSNACANSAIRINTCKENAYNLIQSEFGELESVQWCKNGFYADKSIITGKHPYHMAGLYYFQEASAMSVVEALPISEGDFVLDLCAAPGGKSTHAAEKLNGSGLLVSNEIIPKRAAILSENIERMGFSNVIVTNESPDMLCSKYPAFFDKIIVDAPCSGEGMFRKEPQAITEWSTEHTNSCAMRQRNIIDSALKMLRPGGYIIYSTCTFAPCENEENIEYILKTYTYTELVDILPELCEGTIKKTRRIYPHKQKGEGHFTALIKSNLTSTKNTVQNQKSNVSKENMQLIERFFKDFMTIDIPNGTLFSFGERIFCLPVGINIDKVKVLRAGLYLGDCKKGRFEPSHSLCLSQKKSAFKQIIDFEPASQELISYLKGNTIPCTQTGWVCVCVSGNPIGWGKASAGVLKNHYPKGLRLLG